MTGGLFIVVDGPSGVGKSTHVARLTERMNEIGYDVLATTQPSTEQLGRLARYKTDHYRGLPLACLVAADRYHHIQTTIEPALDRGTHVLCDRYVGSSLVLQQLDDVDPTFIRDINSRVRIPDLTIILVGDPQTSKQRAKERGIHTRFHEMDSATELNLYRTVVEELALADFEIVVIDVEDRATDDINNELLSIVSKRIDQNTSTAASMHQ